MTTAQKAKKALMDMFGGGSKAQATVAKPKPKDLGTGYAAGAAKAVTDRNKQTEAAAKEMDSYRKGGKVKRTGPALLHKDERVLTVSQAKKPAVKKAIGLKAKKK
jgi:hypothetical protein